MKGVNSIGPKQYWFKDGGKIVFQSYDTIVCIIENYEDGNEPMISITSGQPQSKTTAKYLNEFLRLHTSVNNYKNL